MGSACRLDTWTACLPTHLQGAGDVLADLAAASSAAGQGAYTLDAGGAGAGGADQAGSGGGGGVT